MLYGMIKQSSLHTALMACVMVFFLGLGHRALDARYGNVGEQRLPVDPNAFASLPHAIGDWTGQDIPLDERIVEVADVDTYINRVYSRNNFGRPLIFYIGCGSGRGVVSHYPERCYLGSGWIPCTTRKGEILLNNGITLPYNIFEYARKGISEQRISLFQLFVLDGEYYTDVSKANRQLWGSMRSASYYAQVQVAVRSDSLMDMSDADEALLTEFAEDVFFHVDRMFKELLERRNRGEETDRDK
jgi:hypothetical protein